jgi:hypothetical protein
MAYYLTNNWDNLSEDERREIKMQALEAQQKANHTICLWCGEPLCSGDYDFTGSPNNRREICKGYCKRLRYFDMPRQSNTPTTHPLSAHPSEFVGYEPVEVMFGDESEPVTSWAEAYQAILRHIILKDFVFYERMIDLRRSLSAHKKPFLSKKPDGMSCPVEICEDLYAETDFSFHILLEILTDRILKPIQFRYSHIKIVQQ